MDRRPDFPRFYKPMRDPLPPEFYGEIRHAAVIETPANPNPAEELRENARVKEELRPDCPDCPDCPEPEIPLSAERESVEP